MYDSELPMHDAVRGFIQFPTLSLPFRDVFFFFIIEFSKIMFTRDNF